MYIYKNNIPCKHLIDYEENEVESIWLSLRSHLLPRNVIDILLGVVYHSTANKEEDGDKLGEHIQSNIDDFLVKYPNYWKCLRFEDPWTKKKENYEERGQNHVEKSKSNRSKTAPEN